MTSIRAVAAFSFVLLATSITQAQTPAYPRGVQADPCATPIPPGHQLNLDFGQLCRYEAANRKLSPATPERVVYFGDSLTEGWGQRLPGLRADDVVNRGISGQTTAQMLVRFRADVIDLKPRIVHLMMATNDLAGNTGATTVARIQDAIASMAEQARAKGIRVVLASVLPADHFSWRPGIDPRASIRAINQWMAQYAAREGFTFVDYHSALADANGAMKSAYTRDGVHPTSAGYDVMIPLAQDALLRANR